MLEIAVPSLPQESSAENRTWVRKPGAQSEGKNSGASLTTPTSSHSSVATASPSQMAIWESLASIPPGELHSSVTGSGAATSGARAQTDESRASRMISRRSSRAALKMLRSLPVPWVSRLLALSTKTA